MFSFFCSHTQEDFIATFALPYPFSHCFNFSVFAATFPSAALLWQLRMRHRLTVALKLLAISYIRKFLPKMDVSVDWCRTKFGERGFSHAGPTAWNSLPHHLHHISDTGLFKRRLKTELFRRAYVASC